MQIGPRLYDAEPIPEAARHEIEAMLSSGDLFRYTAGLDSAVAALEQDFAAFMGVPFALAVNSCSSSLFLALRAIGIQPGDKVLLPAFTFAAVPSAVVHAGGEPVLVEIGDNFRVDLNDLRAKLGQGAKAFVVSHMRGHTSDMDAIMQLCDAREVPVIEDAAHSLGTLWSGRKIGTIGRIGCFSFQSYKLINAGEGGMLITDDPDLIARAVIMSGAYEHNWKKHPIGRDRFASWQNKLPLYNMRMSNLSAAVVRPQIQDVPRRAADGRANHDRVGAILNGSPWLDVPAPLEQEVRAPDSIQFNLRGFADEEAKEFERAVNAKGVTLQIFGLSEDNARAFWNWEFMARPSDLKRTRAILMRACDVRLPARLGRSELDFIAGAIVTSAEEVQRARMAPGSPNQASRPVQPAPV